MHELEKMEGISDTVKEYIKTNIEILKLETTNKVSVLGAQLVGTIILFSVVFIFLFIISIGFGFYFSELLNDNFLGFLLVGAFYLLVFCIVCFLRKTLIHLPVRDSIIKKILEDN